MWCKIIKLHHQLPDMPLQVNTKIRYRLIRELYEKHAHPDIPLMRTYKKHIYPVYPISRKTLYAILNTPLEELEF